MDQKPPRPRTLQLSPVTAKKAPRSGRHRKHGSSRQRNATELKILANNIRGIIEDISFQNSEQSRENVLRRSYIGIRRSAAAYGEQSEPLFSRRNIVSAFYGENRSEDGVTRETAMQMSNRIAKTERYDSRLQQEGKTDKRQSCPWDLSYFDQHGDNRSLQILASEINHLREIRENEVRDLLTVNNKLQHDLFDADRDICALQEKNFQCNKRLEDMLRVYERIRENLKQCLTKVKDLESLGKFTPLNSDDESASRTQKGDDHSADQASMSSGFNTLSDMSESLPLDTVAMGYEGDGENSTCERRRVGLSDMNELLRDIDSISLDSRSTGCGGSPPEVNNGTSPHPERKLLARLHEDVNSLSQINRDQSQEIERLRSDLTSCRKHMSSSQFQLEAVEIECSRLLAMEDQIASVITLLQRAKDVHLHRQILGDIIFNAVTSSVSLSSGSSGIPADVFLRELQERLSMHPQPALSELHYPIESKKMSSSSGKEHSAHALPKKRPGSGDSKRFGAVFSDLSLSQPVLEFGKPAERSLNVVDSKPKTTEKKDMLEALKFIDDEDDQLSEAESFHSVGKHLVGDFEKN
ncbi:uncharacterized protein LOC134248071 [Saccostrea cucullata]|uniref:uncharacterized protein LOC134248071 n=1 Tax=Saccostrea cuccullata TaxID=36930 RepID=UPI002ED2E5C0